MLFFFSTRLLFSAAKPNRCTRTTSRSAREAGEAESVFFFDNLPAFCAGARVAGSPELDCVDGDESTPIASCRRVYLRVSCTQKARATHVRAGEAWTRRPVCKLRDQAACTNRGVSSVIITIHRAFVSGL